MEAPRQDRSNVSLILQFAAGLLDALPAGDAPVSGDVFGPNASRLPQSTAGYRQSPPVGET